MATLNEQLIDQCNDLIRFDHDAIGAYDQAIDGIEEVPIKQQLLAFRADHLRHVQDLSEIVLRLGGTPPETPGVRGVLRSTMTRVAGLIGTEAVLMAMRSNEKVLNDQYADRAIQEFPEFLLAVIQRNFLDEQTHLAWIEQALSARIWEELRPEAP